MKYNIVDFGARSDGLICTKYIQAAIDRCFLEGGGEVIIPQGRFITGCIRLRSDVALHLMEDAELLGSTEPEDYNTYLSDTIEPISEEEREKIVSTAMPQAKCSSSAYPYSKWNNAVIRAINAKNIAIIGEKILL